ncbi:MAG TPA: hypothetical protein VGZ27_14830 [Vicinamibacterales bacterium]|nr:hypothetical protein [Vicinamibacterales bacterium]
MAAGLAGASVKPPLRRPARYALFKSIVEHHLAKFRIALKSLQKLRAWHLKGYLGGLTCASATILVHRAVLTGALGAAVEDGVLKRRRSRSSTFTVRRSSPSR